MSAHGKVAGLTLALAAISQVHKVAILVSDLRAMIAALPVGLTGLRDRALLLAGFAGAFRRSELVRPALREGEIGIGHEEWAELADGKVLNSHIRAGANQRVQGPEAGVEYWDHGGIAPDSGVCCRGSLCPAARRMQFWRWTGHTRPRTAPPPFVIARPRSPIISTQRTPREPARLLGHPEPSRRDAPSSLLISLAQLGLVFPSSPSS
jgi:hypothetical protein